MNNYTTHLLCSRSRLIEASIIDMALETIELPRCRLHDAHLTLTLSLSRSLRASSEMFHYHQKSAGGSEMSGREIR